MKTRKTLKRILAWNVAVADAGILVFRVPVLQISRLYDIDCAEIVGYGLPQWKERFQNENRLSMNEVATIYVTSPKTYTLLYQNKLIRNFLNRS
jgi:hypothetical protein